ncbi:MAG: FkbM family methyltransferase [Phycisphaerales bacterium]|nr:FkbM family methyltransferase [Phycisphaerales bacterium]
MSNGLKVLLLPITRNELPGWGWFVDRFGKIGYKDDHRWANAKPKLVRGKWHGYEMKLDMTNWSARHTYFLGRYYELHIQLLLNAVLKSGDRMIDIGANVGMITLHAAHLVGPNGRIDSFEPNPTCLAQLEEVISRNHIEHIHVHPIGLSDAQAELELKQNDAHTGIGTFADVNPDDVVSSTIAQVKKGDDVFANDKNAPKIIKIDVEGFEYRALKGMEQTLHSWKSMVVMEMHEHHLNRAGTSTQEVGEFMTGLGYRAFDVNVKRKLLRYSIDLIPINDLASLNTCRDVLWTAHEGHPLD